MRRVLLVGLMASQGLAKGGPILGPVLPERYSLDLDISLRSGRFRGHEVVQVAVDQPTSTVVLHAVDLRIRSARVGKESARISLDSDAQTVTLALASPLPKGPATLEIDYDGKLGQSLRGLYMAKVGREKYAFTQMEPTDARRMLPCIDEPAAKARFALTITIDRDWQVVSNGAALQVKRSGQKKTFRFAETPRISPYLLAVAVAPFASKSTQAKSGVPVTVYALPEKVAFLDYAMETAVELLGRMEAYFGIPYPYGKLDLLAIPEFEAGAMENAGAIFFRESLLLAAPKEASADTKRTIAIILAHEMAHQWFGNLVTMAWWDDLWLNEAFATWFEFKVVDGWKPEWNLWVDFQQMKRGPMALDALATARPIRAEANTPAEINEMFDPITYEKGASVLRMLELYLGEKSFQQGVTGYLKQHAEGNARAADLWQALEEASKKPVASIAPDWIDQPGFPLLRIAMREKSGHTYAVAEQKRHFARRNSDKGNASWKVPVCFKFDAGKGQEWQCELLSQTRGEWQILTDATCLNYIVPNAGQGGYYRTLLEPRWLAALGRRLSKVLSPEERIGLLDDQWALVESGDLAMPEFLAMLANFRDEKSRAVLEVIATRLAGMRDRYITPDALPHFERFVETTLGRAFSDLGWDAAESDDEERKLARSAVVHALGAVARARDIMAEAARRAARYLHNTRNVDPTLATTIVNLAAIRGDASLYRRYFARMKAADAPEERERFLHALSWFEDDELVTRTLQATLGNDIRQQDVGRLVSGVLGNPKGREPGWKFVQKNFAALMERASQFGIERVVRALGATCERKMRDEIATFFERHPVEEVKRALAETLEGIDLCIEIREREERRVAAWLRDFK